MNDYEKSQQKAGDFNTQELYEKLKNDPEFKKETRFLELTEDILATIEPRLSRIEQDLKETRKAVCKVAQAVSYLLFWESVPLATNRFHGKTNLINDTHKNICELRESMIEITNDLQDTPKDK